MNLCTEFITDVYVGITASLTNEMPVSQAVASTNFVMNETLAETVGVCYDKSFS